ncbi:MULTISPECIES: ThiF family adenylyltransferase [unclassified Nocardioides]|uniref:ThiF family adenylyltransferase n=1 Tax=unclassified Nocardioides TaxID=2615069 RepID=UPI0030150A1B
MTRKKNTQPALTNWQRRALADLRAQAKNQPDLLTVGAQHPDPDGNLWVQFSLATGDLPAPKPDGFTFKPVEEFVLLIAPTDDQPPTVTMDHYRFMGTPHVLSGFYLCLYLDVSREWNPDVGINGKDGVLDRLWDWMTKATQNDFNPTTALYHAVGGVPHVTLRSQAIVVRRLPTPKARVATAYLHRRTPTRLDLTINNAADDSDTTETTHVPVLFMDSDMPLGAGHHALGQLLTLIKNPRPFGIDRYAKPPIDPSLTQWPSPYEQARVKARHYTCEQWPPTYNLPRPPRPYITTPDAALVTALIASATRNPPGTPQRLLLAVPHPIGKTRHLLALELVPEQADELRQLAALRTEPLIEYVPEYIEGRAPIQWCYVSDERTDVTTRRDTSRPVSSLLNKTIAVLGCGGLGSWIAEFATRAGAEKVIISDNGRVTGGLLVRQNYVETDDGAAKITGLAKRLDAISDTVKIEMAGALTIADMTYLATTCDLIIDATISLKMTNQLNIVAANPNRTAVIAQVATDARTGTLGYATINPPGDTRTMTQMDHHLRDTVRADGTLERYRYFWEEPDPQDELVPTRGCSTPTFHGSAADLAALSGSLTTLIAKHLTLRAHGAHLIALPHSDVQPSHKYLAMDVFGEASLDVAGAGT